MVKLIDGIAYLMTGFGLSATTIVIPLALGAHELTICGANTVGWLAILYRTRPRTPRPPPIRRWRAYKFLKLEFLRPVC